MPTKCEKRLVQYILASLFTYSLWTKRRIVIYRQKPKVTSFRVCIRHTHAIPGQHWGLQPILCTRGPVQERPPQLALGLSHDLNCSWVPPPHSLVQLPKSIHSLQTPSTIKGIYKTTIIHDTYLATLYIHTFVPPKYVCGLTRMHWTCIHTSH